MKFVPVGVSATIGRQLLRSQKHAPTLLFAGGIAGMIGTVVLASRATLKVDEVLQKAQQDLYNVEHVQTLTSADKYDSEDAKKDKAYIYLRTTREIAVLYGPAVVCGVFSIAALTKSHHILSQRNAALTAAFTALNTRFDEYRDKVAEKYGREAEEEVYHELAPCEIEDPETGKKKKVKRATKGSIYARFWGRDTSRSWEPIPAYNIAFLTAQQNYWNDRLQSRGFVFLNEVYDALGLEWTPEGQVVGWVKGNRDNYISFHMHDGEHAEPFVDFVAGQEEGVWLDFNVDGVIYELI